MGGERVLRDRYRNVVADEGAGPTFDEALSATAFATATWWDLDGESYPGVLYEP
jgi:hypothetical protein